MHYLRFWGRWFPYTNHAVVQSFEDCIRTIPVWLHLRRKSFTSNWIPQPHFSTFLEFMIRCLDVVPRLHSFCRHADSFPSEIVNVFKMCLETWKVLLWLWRRIRRTTEQKITGRTKLRPNSICDGVYLVVSWTALRYPSRNSGCFRDGICFWSLSKVIHNNKDVFFDIRRPR